MRTTCYAIGAVIFVLIAGCVGKFEDVTSRPQFSTTIGSSFETRSDLLAIGVSMEQNYGSTVDIVYLVPEPGFGGPEVLTREKITLGSKVTVTGALALKGRVLPSEKIYFVLSGVDCDACKKAKVIVRAADDVNGGLAPHFEPVGR
jgi:hypothetical protein